MAEVNVRIECDDEENAKRLFEHMAANDLYTQGLEQDWCTVGAWIKPSNVTAIEKFARAERINMTIETWPIDMEYDDAEESGDLETVGVSV